MTAREIDELADKVHALGDHLGRRISPADLPVLREAMEQLRKFAAVKRMMGQ